MKRSAFCCKTGFCRASCGAAGRAAAKAFLPHGLLWKKQRDLGAWASGSTMRGSCCPGAWRRGGTRRMDRKAFPAVHEAGGLFGDVLMSARTVGARSSFARQGRPRSCFYRWTHCSAAARRMAEATAHGCCPICWRRSRRNTGHYSAISASCPFRTGGPRLEAYLRQEAGKNRRDRLRRNDARADGPVPWHEPQRPFAPARHDAAGRPLRASPGKPPTPERYRNVNDRIRKSRTRPAGAPGRPPARKGRQSHKRSLRLLRPVR